MDITNKINKVGFIWENLIARNFLHDSIYEIILIDFKKQFKSIRENAYSLFYSIQFQYFYVYCDTR